MLPFKMGFKYFPLAKQLEYLREYGVMLGSRMRDDRKVFLYIVKNIFVEVIYKDDSTEKEVEQLEVFKNLSRLNQYLKKEFKTTI
jgi:hypothetical protein